MPERAYVSLKIYDALGRVVAVLVNEEKNSGSFTATWNAVRFSSGLYFARLTTEKFSAVKKIMLIK